MSQSLDAISTPAPGALSLKRPRSKDGSNNREKKTKRNSVSSASSVCPICDETIKEPSKHRKGEDSIYCEGYCEAWIHRRCAGLSVTNFAAFSDSGENHTYFCLYCELQAQKAEIENLMSTITLLQTTLSELKRKLDSFQQTAQQTSKPQALLLSNTASKGTNQFKVPAMLRRNSI